MPEEEEYYYDDYVLLSSRQGMGLHAGGLKGGWHSSSHLTKRNKGPASTYEQ